MKQILRISKIGSFYQAHNMRLQLLYENTDFDEFIQDVIGEADVIIVDNSLRKKVLTK